MKVEDAPKKRSRRTKAELLKISGLTRTEMKLVQAFKTLGCQRGTLEAAAEEAGISYAYARELMARPEVKASVELKRIKIKLGSVMTREERLRWLSDMIRDPSSGGRVQLGAMDMLNKLTNEYRTPGDDEENPLHVKERSEVKVSLAERIARLRGGGNAN